MGNDTTMAFYDSENLIYQDEDKGEEDCEVQRELARLLLQEEREPFSPTKSQWIQST